MVGGVPGGIDGRGPGGADGGTPGAVAKGAPGGTDGGPVGRAVGGADGGGAGGGAVLGVGGVSGCAAATRSRPHFMQKRASSGAGVPQCGQYDAMERSVIQKTRAVIRRIQRTVFSVDRFPSIRCPFGHPPLG
ncbi:hypothetical protein GCM10017771_33380 [Streptomyces capitiformicae]|uniref:Uncharacterized protein n=1 Tax=Streptomyces capitiformicae TaxID=2014920 RepID=A0A919L8X1_9ACTN|nr:hypothetical protein GCM10017771_33380 [Streptomyces capitiformicae]